MRKKKVSITRSRAFAIGTGDSTVTYGGSGDSFGGSSVTFGSGSKSKGTGSKKISFGSNTPLATPEEIKAEKDLQKFIRMEQALLRKEQAEKQKKFLAQIKLL